MRAGKRKYPSDDLSTDSRRGELVAKPIEELLSWPLRFAHLLLMGIFPSCKKRLAKGIDVNTTRTLGPAQFSTYDRTFCAWACRTPRWKVHCKNFS